MATKAEKKLEGYVLLLKRVLAQRDVVEKFAASYDHERDGNQVPVLLETLNNINKQFQEAQEEIERLDVEHFEEHIKVRTTFEDRYCVLKGFLLSKLDNGRPAMNSTMNSSFIHCQAIWRSG